MKGTVKQVIFSVAVNAVAFITLWVNAKNINVIGQFVFLLIPLIISIIETGVINKTFKEEVSLKVKVAIPTMINLIYMIGEFLVINAYGVNDLEKFTQQYSSEYVTVSENNSPVGAIVLFLVLSFLGHYYVVKFTNAKS